MIFYKKDGKVFGTGTVGLPREFFDDPSIKIVTEPNWLDLADEADAPASAPAKKSRGKKQKDDTSNS